MLGVGLLVLALIAAYAGLSQPATPGISRDEIREAIALGRVAEPEPYKLRSIFPTSKGPAALIYTPFLRVVRASAEARKAGRPYEVDDVDGQDSSPLVHVVMSADVVAPTGILTEEDPIRMELLAEPNQQWLGTSKSRSAIWVSQDRDRVEAALPGSSHQGVVVGAFAREQLSSDGLVVTYRKRRMSDGYTEITSAWAVIKTTDAEKWR